MQFVVVHALPGRMRLRARFGFSLRRAQSLAEGLDAIDGIEGVRVNPHTGSVLLLYADEAAKRAACVLLCAPLEDLPAAAAAGQEPEPAGKPSLVPFIRYVVLRPFMPLLLRAATAVVAALPFLCKGFAALCRGRLNVEVLDAAAIGISLLRGDFKTARLLALLLGFGEALELWTRRKSLDSLADSLALDIDTVWVRREGREVHIAISELQEGDQVVVRAGSAIPVDGVVVEGEASVNQSSMTSEPLGVLRAPGASVFAGTVVEEGEIAIRPTGVGDGTRLRQIVRFIEDSESLKAGVQGRAERLADAVVPFSFLLAGLVWLVTRNTARAAAVLLVDYSCALKLATPLAILASMKEGVGRGVLVKGGRFLESLASADAVVFDKTGTLTKSRPEVVEVVPGEGYSREEVLRIAACLEEHFPHPVARAVVRRAEVEDLHHKEEHSKVEYVVAHGIASRLHGKRVLLGSRHYLEHDEGIVVNVMHDAVARLSREGRSLLYLAVDGELIGLIGIADPLRPEAATVIRTLRERGVRIVMLTGDDERTAAAVAARLGIDEYRAQVLPTDKADVVRELQAAGHTVAMLGDGINDSPGLSAADVGVTLSDGADLAREVADVVLTGGSLENLLTAIDLGKSTMRRIHSNFGVTVTLNTVFLVSGLSGLLQPGLSAVLHNLTTVGVSLNAMRPLLGAAAKSGEAS